MPDSIRVLVVDDDPLVVDSLARYLSTTDDIAVVARATNGADALAALEHTDVDVILCDIHMPRMDGVTFLERLRATGRHPAFLAITALDNDRTMLRILGLGGAGYILKSQTPEAIIRAVRDAHAGGVIVSPDAMNALVRYLPGAPRRDVAAAPQPRLTGLEQAVLELLCAGHSNAEIAERLRYSESTIKKQVSNLLTAFGVKSRLDLVVKVLNQR